VTGVNERSQRACGVKDDGQAYATPYSILIPIISLQHIDMRIPYFPIAAL